MNIKKYANFDNTFLKAWLADIVFYIIIFGLIRLFSILSAKITGIPSPIPDFTEIGKAKANLSALLMLLLIVLSLIVGFLAYCTTRSYIFNLFAGRKYDFQRWKSFTLSTLLLLLVFFLPFGIMVRLGINAQATSIPVTIYSAIVILLFLHFRWLIAVFSTKEKTIAAFKNGFSFGTRNAIFFLRNYAIGLAMAVIAWPFLWAISFANISALEIVFALGATNIIRRFLVGEFEKMKK